MKTLNRFLWFFLLAFLLGISGSALGSDVGTAAAASKDAVLTQQLQQDFSNHLDFRNVTVVVDDRVALLQGSVETYREKMDAERLARKHHGIEGVRDFIAVQPIVPVSSRHPWDAFLSLPRHLLLKKSRFVTTLSRSISSW